MTTNSLPIYTRTLLTQHVGGESGQAGITHLFAVARGLVESLEDQRRSGGDHRHGRLEKCSRWGGRKQAAVPTAAAAVVMAGLPNNKPTSDESTHRERTKNVVVEHVGNTRARAFSPSIQKA